MKTCHFLHDYLREDIISKIYHNDVDFMEQVPSTQEYHKIMKEIKKQEKELLPIEKFRNYLEIRNIKEAIETEEQFKLGFRTAIKIIIDGYNS